MTNSFASNAELMERVESRGEARAPGSGVTSYRALQCPIAGDATADSILTKNLLSRSRLSSREVQV